MNVPSAAFSKPVGQLFQPAFLSRWLRCTGVVDEPVEIEHDIDRLEPETMELGREAATAVDDVRDDAVHLMTIVGQRELEPVSLCDLARRVFRLAGRGGEKNPVNRIEPP